MTSSELRANLLQAQTLLADVYHWANSQHTKYTGMKTNSEIASQMSTADSCINDALEELE
jgi:hypothetical protein